MANKIKISLKYKFLMVLIITLALGFSTFFGLAFKTFSEDKKLFVMELNLAVLKTALSDTRAELKSRVDELQVFLPKIYSPDTVVTSGLFRELSLQNLPQDLLGVKFYRKNVADNSFKLEKQFVNTELLESKSLSDASIQEIEQNYPAPIEQFSFTNGTTFLNRSISVKTNSGSSYLPVLTLLVPGTFINDNTKSVIIVVDLLQDFLRKKLSQSEIADVFFVTKSGSLLSHSSSALLAQNTKKIFEHPIIPKLKTRQLPRESFELERNGEVYLTNMSESAIPETYVVSQIKQSEAFAALKTLMRETLLTGIFILGIALILSILFSNRLTSNIKKLREAAQTIGEKGKLDTPLAIQSNDEIQNVAESFNQMSSEIQDLLEKTKESARMETELETAKILQSTLLSSNHVDTDAAQVVPFYLSASETGGDIWDAYLSGNTLTILVGDATGHGAPAAIVTAVAKSCFATLNNIYPETPLSPDAFLEKLNKVIYESCKGQLLMTMAVVQIDLNSGQTWLSNAGHEAPLLLKAPKSDDEKLKSEAVFVRGERLGFSPDSSFEKIETTMELGDKLLIYTDGVSEAVNVEGKQFGERALKKLFNKVGLETLEVIKDQIYSELKSFMGMAPQQDDITYVLFKWNKIMEKIHTQATVKTTLVEPPHPPSVPVAQPLEEVDYEQFMGEQLCVESLEVQKRDKSDVSIDPTGLELASEWSTAEYSIDSEPSRSVAPSQKQPDEDIYIINEGVHRIILPAPPSQPTKTLEEKLIELAKNTDFTEKEVDTHYSRIEEEDDAA